MPYDTRERKYWSSRHLTPELEARIQGTRRTLVRALG